MNTEEIFQQVKDIVVEQLGVSEDIVTMQTTFVDDLNADSLGIVELIMEIEEGFDLEIPDTDVEKIITTGDGAKYIQSHKIVTIGDVVKYIQSHKE